MNFDAICDRLKAVPAFLTPVYRPLLYAPEHGLYQPPGLYYTRATAGDGQALFNLPPPYHPVETLVVLSEPKWWDQTPEALLAASEARAKKWTEQVRTRFAPALRLQPSETFLLYHLFTPLHTNGGGVPKSDLCPLTSRLYECAGIDTYCRSAMDAWESRGISGPLAAQVCNMNFWGELTDTKALVGLMS